MGVYIKGMEMPEHCGECKLKAEYDDETFCPFFADNVEYWIAAGRRHEDCTLVPVPPHGRLIDADALAEQTITEWLCGNPRVNVPWRAVSEAPTIIPASFENPTKNARYSQDNPAEEGE